MTEELLKRIDGQKTDERDMFFRKINNGKRIEAVWVLVIEGKNGNFAEEFSPRASIINRESLKDKNLLTIEEAAKRYDMSGNLKPRKVKSSTEKRSRNTNKK